ncbi:MAG: ATP-dependent RecD-like DNA helicase [Oscillospiraceae bacterium]|nr:ATP-dependent RecD-like DNA helicase [Oscillospiraceae bacterium]
MDQTLYEMTGTVEHIIYHNDKNEYTILEMEVDDELVVAVGTMPFVTEGEGLHVVGKWVNHPSFGEQFKVETFERTVPATAAGMLKYLSSGAVKGIGKATAGKIVEMFGDNALEVIEKEPDRLCAIRGITKEKAEKISEEFQRVFGIKELMLYLSKYGIGAEEAIRVWKCFGSQSIAMIEHDPFCLCTDEVRLDFQKADLIAQQLKKPRDDKNRIMSGILYVLQHNACNGHTCLPQDKLTAACAKLLTVSPEEVTEALKELVDNESLIQETFTLQSGEKNFLFTRRLYQAETYAASRLSMLLRFPAQAIVGVDDAIAEMEQRFGITYAEQQKQAIRMALGEGVLILTGKPGTGKTTTLNAMITILEEKGERVFLAAPTGRAAKRMSEVTGREAKTIHRLLQVEWNEQDRPRFAKNEKNLLECDALILDEMSMVDVSLFESVLRALPLGCRLIMVGDSHQLPSVGPGNVLGDLIRTGVIPVVELDEIFRQAMESLIITNAHKIVNGEMPQLNCKDKDFFFLPGYDAKTISDTIVGLCAQRLPVTYGYTVWSEIQVLSPSRKGELGTVELNRKLQDAVNPPEKGKQEVTINGTIFREGDKVMQVKNNYDLVWSRSDGTSGEGVYNGDIGMLLDIDKRSGTYTVQMDDRIVLYTADNLSELELAYAMTVHKSQGNEFRAVVMPMFPGPPQLYYRNLLYTGITRAKDLLILVGMTKTLRAMVENDRKTKRYCGLYHFLKGYHDEAQSDG